MSVAIRTIESGTSFSSNNTYESSWTTLETVDKTQLEDFVEKQNILVLYPALNEPLSAKFYHSHAYKTFRTRSPHMIHELIHSMRDNEEWIMKRCGDYARFDLRRVIWSLNILRTEILQNSPFKLFYDQEPDAKEWNVAIKRLANREKNQWFTSTWLFAECYLYRRIWAAFRRAETLRNFDYFSPIKFNTAQGLANLMNKIVIATRGLPLNQMNFQLMLRLSLWGNRCDLSNTADPPSDEMLQLIDEYNKDLIIDQSMDVWHLLTENKQTSSQPIVIDIVFDNAAFELFTDLLLAEYILETGLAHKVRFHAKSIPWFVSDVTAADFHWMLNSFLRNKLVELSSFGHKMRSLLRDQRLELCSINDFWTKPTGFSSMRQLSPCLYVELSFSTLVIFKGDLNYRKLLDDINRSSTTPFRDCLGGFMPTSICALRVIKSDIYSGMPLCTVDWLTEDDPHWMMRGEKAVIQLAVKTRP
ncbi:damage-control phosphatase ARMT1 [Drosophila sulfurigaster albostrigata]|uniref:damage-control phosphatase ARMT1 n=1 Tax=Drosophila sulfurigaster albostrigata TaxID=89887 RepID=UPI002D21DEE8|nr:damage-control phosphatase ARMT1 [Drosophila sulfurigaster albostrigata]